MNFVEITVVYVISKFNEKREREGYASNINSILFSSEKLRKKYNLWNRIGVENQS